MLILWVALLVRRWRRARLVPAEVPIPPPPLPPWVDL